MTIKTNSGVMFSLMFDVFFRYEISVSPAPPAITLAIIAGMICANTNRSISAEIPRNKASMKYFKKLLPLIMVCPKKRAPEFFSCLLIRLWCY